MSLSSEALAPEAVAVTIDPLVDSRWAGLIEGRDAHLFSSPRWLGVLAEVYGFEFRVNALELDGELVAGVLYSVIDDARGARIVSAPFCDVNDPIVRSTDDWQRLSGPLFARKLGIEFRTRSNEAVLQDERFDSSEAGVWHEMDARRDPAEQFDEFATLPRRMIRRAEREGLAVRVSTSREDLRAFFDLHLAVRKHRHGLLAQPYGLFETIASSYFEVGDGALVVADAADGTFAGGCLVLVSGDTAFYKFSASHPDHRRAGISHVTLFEGLQYAHERGLRAFDLGRSDFDGPGLLDFKRRFRPIERTITTHLHRPENVSADPMISTLGALTELLVQPEVPDSVTEEAGRILYRFFA